MVQLITKGFKIQLYLQVYKFTNPEKDFTSKLPYIKNTYYSHTLMMATRYGNGKPEALQCYMFVLGSHHTRVSLESRGSVCSVSEKGVGILGF